MPIVVECSDKNGFRLATFLGLSALGTVLDVITDILREFNSPFHNIVSIELNILLTSIDHPIRSTLAS